MTDKDVFKSWSPINAKWVNWVKPVPFIGITGGKQTDISYNFRIVKIEYIEELSKDTAYIIDLPGYTSIMEGLGFAQLGLRPISLYNGTNPQSGAMSLVDNKEIQNALLWGARELEKMKIEDNALPVFLLDSNRILRFKMSASIFDNSWDIYEQDIPSYECFSNNGIRKIIVRGEKIQRDLAKILYKFQKKGMTIFLANGYEPPKEVRIKKPPRKDKFH